MRDSVVIHRIKQEAKERYLEAIRTIAVLIVLGVQIATCLRVFGVL